MTKLYVIAGHGAGDPGAVGNGYQEAERVRALASRMKALGGSEVEVLNTSRNWYADNGISGLSIPSDSCLVELHMDSAGAGARGGHVIIKAGFEPDEYDKALAEFVSGHFPGRSTIIAKRSDLANVNRAAARGINYRLLECCFISNAQDVAKFNANIDAVAAGIIGAFGIGAGSAPAVPSAPPSAPTPTPKPSAPAGKVTIRYGLHVIGDGWLDEVTDFGGGSDGFAGLPFYSHDFLYAKVDRGSLRYRVHTREDGWLDWVYKGDRSDTVNGCAGIAGHAIDGVQAYYTTPEGEDFQQVWYRSQTTQREGWLAVCCDDGTSVDGYDGWAGMYGEPMDRLQMAVGTSNPF